LGFHFAILKGRWYGNQLKSQNWHFCGPIFIVVLPFRNAVKKCQLLPHIMPNISEYPCLFYSVNSGVIIPNLTKILNNAEKFMQFNLLKSKYCNPFQNGSTTMKIGPQKRQFCDFNWLPWQRPLRHRKMIFQVNTDFAGLVCISVWMIIRTFIWRSPDGRCYGDQLNLGNVRRCLQDLPLLFALAFNNGSHDREATLKRLNSNNPATSCTHLVNVRPIISEFMLFKRANFLRDSIAI